MGNRIRTVLTAFALLLAGSLSAVAETAAELEREVAQISAHLEDARRLLTERNAELSEIRGFLRQVRTEWLQPWDANERRIGQLQAEIEALRRMGAFNQNSRELNDRMRGLLAERARLDGLDGQTVDGCSPACTTMTGLRTVAEGKFAAEQALTREIADIEGWRNQLFDELTALKPRLAASRAAEKAALEAELTRLKDERARQAGLLKPGETYLLPSLDGAGPPRVLTREEFDAEVTVAWFEIGTSADFDDAELIAQVRTLARNLLRQSEALKRQARADAARLDREIAALEQRLGLSAGVTTTTADTCPHSNPDAGGTTLSHRFPAGADRTYLSCTYFPGTPGPLKALVRYEDGKETGIAAYFSLDGGHHLDNILNARKPGDNGADCRYHSASAIREYRLYSNDKSLVTMFCEPDGTPGRCDFIAHDGAARGCRMSCTDQCASLREQIGWPPMQ